MNCMICTSFVIDSTLFVLTSPDSKRAKVTGSCCVGVGVGVVVVVVVVVAVVVVVVVVVVVIVVGGFGVVVFVGC